MIYFKTVIIYGCSHHELETALRKVSLKRTRSLDMGSSSMDMGTTKLFWGYAGKNGLTFTRIRASFERVLPKLIIRLSSDEVFGSYQIRLSLISTAVFFLFSIGWLVNLIVFIKGGNTVEDFLTLTVFTAVFFSLVFVEIKLANWKVNKAIRQATQSLETT